MAKKSACTCGHSRVKFPVALGKDMHALNCPSILVKKEIKR